MTKPILDVVIPTALIADRSWMVRTFSSLQRSTVNEFRLIIVVNSPLCSAIWPGILQLILRESGCHNPIILDMGGVAGFARASNYGLTYSDAPWVCLLSDDVELIDGWDTKLMAHVTDGADISLPSLHEPGRANSRAGLHDGANIVEDACFICVMFPRSTIERFGLFSTHPALSQLGNDNEYCHRIQSLSGRIVVAGDCCVKAGMRTTIGQLTGRGEEAKANAYLTKIY